ncbi:hypothetical protein M3080_05910 [Parasutterella secunda]|uniref:hypothetical protein n=1 Tax=Parasutterella secunda TaxID=626947 RepID=UPI002011E989|nr:hypothetical protein [Parasutterella secunda]MCL1596897.1 hypothetical protein [Parasutterella secunda]MDM8086873.1 hypothetical protein [Parasutterella secunda]MDM8113224.1 hypothetical protein [Parasutterella secunda]MDM8218442.1 hypothetical protein [Parasutterella secunda]MDM8225582.1 hypothetical protein [Parasutterella secunda]
MKITKILASEATPAKAILNRAQHVALTSLERDNLPAQVIVNGVTVETEVSDKRPLEVGDVLLDDAGHFYVVDAAPESVLMIKGDEEFAAEAAVALLNRGIRVAQVENGFAIAKDEALQQLLTDAGLEFEEVMMPFDPIKLPKRHHGGGCCCGGHHHHEHGEGCGCHGGHHHHDEGEGCCCGHHDHEHSEGCACGGEHHHHHHEDGECCCGHHDHEEGCECGGEHHHHHEDGCCCGHHHDHDEEHHHHSHQRHYHHEEKNKAE